MAEALEFWDREVVDPKHVTCMEHPDVRRYMNRIAFGNELAWPFDWFSATFPQKFERALSIGCGAGSLERDLVRRDIVSQIDALDGSIGSLKVAADEARKEGCADRIRYFAADFNRLALPEDTYDIVLVHQALHHVENLEDLFAQIMLALKPTGLLYFDEYVGPSRSDWNGRLIADQRAVYNALPSDVRLEKTLLYPIQADDPSEAVRSSEILATLEIGFELLEKRDYGGNLLSVIYPRIDWNRADASLLDELIAREEAVLRDGAASYYTIVVARPKRGELRDAASLLYRIEGQRSRRQRSMQKLIDRASRFPRRVVRAIERRVRKVLPA
jgi:SAM-dependent methyltransferase